MKKRSFMALLLAVAFLMGCGNVMKDVITENTEIAEGTESVESTQVEAFQTEGVENKHMEGSEITESDANLSEEMIYTEQGNLYLIEDVQYNPENEIDMNALEADGSKYKLVSSVNIYHIDKSLAGYTKENFLVRVVASDDEWSYCNLGAESENYLVKTDELMEAISEQDKKMLIAASATPTPTPAEKINTETPPVASVPVASESVESTSVPEPSAVEQPAAEESDKYTPEEAIAVYRSIMEANGITWDPSIKEFASWGTGFIFLDKGWIDENAYSQVEAYKMGDTAGNSFTKYYLEVTGSDENCVYVTEWSCD